MPGIRMSSVHRADRRWRFRSDTSGPLSHPPPRRRSPRFRGRRPRSMGDEIPVSGEGIELLSSRGEGSAGAFPEHGRDVPSWTAGVSPASSRHWEQSGRDARGPQKQRSGASHFRSRHRVRHGAPHDALFSPSPGCRERGGELLSSREPALSLSKGEGSPDPPTQPILVEQS
jgi:hypothetical protein